MLNQNLGMLERLMSPSPKFFKIVGLICMVLSAVSGIISFLSTEFDLPSWLLLIGDKSVWISGLVGKFVAAFTVDFTAKMKAEALPKDFK
jgi:hypothetical protein